MQSKELVLKWLSELATETGRSEEEIKTDGLLFTDFKIFEAKINFEDRSYVVFRHSIVLQSDNYPGIVAIFTEHNGYYEFPFGEEDELITI